MSKSKKVENKLVHNFKRGSRSIMKKTYFALVTFMVVLFMVLELHLLKDRSKEPR